MSSKDEALAVSSFFSIFFWYTCLVWCNGSQLFDSVQPHGLESLEPASNKDKRRPPEAEKKEKEKGKEKGSHK